METNNFEIKVEVVKYQELTDDELVLIGKLVQDMTKLFKKAKISVPIKFTAQNKS